MICCPSENKYYDEKIFKRLRSIKNLDIKMKLKSDVKNKNFLCEFKQIQEKWKGNVDSVYNSANYENEKENEEIQNKKNEIANMELEIEELEKEYLAKTVRLLYMVQTHCQVKTENEYAFEEYGIKTGNVFVDNNNINIKDIEIIKDNNSEKEKKKQLIEA